MPFEKGQSGNPAGKAKKTTYKIGAEQRDFLRDFLLGNKRKFKKHLAQLPPKDFVHIYITLMQYVLPKPATAEIKEVPKLESFIAMTPEERQDVIKEIQQSLYDEQQ